MKTSSPDLSRRHFLRQASCAAVGTAGMLSALSQLRLIGALAADSSDVRRAAALPGDYKALVCLFLGGGNDGNSVLVPHDATSHAAYASARGALAIERGSLLPISPRAYSDGRSYALHPSLTELHRLFGQGKLGFIGNVGTLARPTTLADFKANRALPYQLFSHSDQAVQWMSSIPEGGSDTGWGGRLADLVHTLNTNNEISTSISLSGNNRFQVGRQVTQLSVGSTGPYRLDVTASQTSAKAMRYLGVKNLMGLPQTNLLGGAFAETTRNAIVDGEVLAAALTAAPTLRTTFPSSPTSDRLKLVARLISTAPTLGLKRQIFFVQLGGWDLHGGQVDGHAPLLNEISEAMGAFYDATVELGAENQVTTFTASDFGRTYAPNAGGTDHGWGNVQWVMGGAVRGGEIYGRMPSQQINGPDDVGRGRWIPSTSIDEYNATLATWFGVSQANLATVLPNIGRFANPNLGFMA